MLLINLEPAGNFNLTISLESSQSAQKSMKFYVTAIAGNNIVVYSYFFLN